MLRSARASQSRADARRLRNDHDLPDPRRRRGPEVVPAAAQARCHCPARRPLRRRRRPAGTASCAAAPRCPRRPVEAVAAADATLFGATQSPTTGEAGVRSNDGKPAVYRSPILALRKQFDLYANLRPAAPLAARQPADRPPDRPREHRGPLQRPRAARGRHGHRRARDHPRGQRAHRARRVRAGAAPRRAALARPGPLRKVTIVHKANVLKLTDGLFRESCLAVAASTPTSRSTRCWSTRPRCGWCRTRAAST